MVVQERGEPFQTSASARCIHLFPLLFPLRALVPSCETPPIHPLPATNLSQNSRFASAFWPDLVGLTRIHFDRFDSPHHFPFFPFSAAEAQSLPSGFSPPVSHDSPGLGRIHPTRSPATPTSEHFSFQLSQFQLFPSPSSFATFALPRLRDGHKFPRPSAAFSAFSFPVSAFRFPVSYDSPRLGRIHPTRSPPTPDL